VEIDISYIGSPILVSRFAATKRGRSRPFPDRKVQEVVNANSLKAKDEFSIHRVVLQSRGSAPQRAPKRDDVSRETSLRKTGRVATLVRRCFT
jgi:hypothetical protein